MLESEIRYMYLTVLMPRVQNCLLLKDGTFLIVEYKGANRWSNDDSKEKRRLGELWALKSNGDVPVRDAEGEGLGCNHEFRQRVKRDRIAPYQ